MPDDQDKQPSPVEIHAARIRDASPRALREKESKWRIAGKLLKGSPLFDPECTVASLAEEHGVSTSAIYKWLTKLETGTGTAIDLLELPRGGRGKSRAITDQGLIEFATANCLQFCSTTGKPKPAFAAVMRLIETYADDYDWKTPSRYALRRLLWSIPKTLRIYSAEGKEGLSKAMPKPPVHRAGRPNEAWVTDHKVMHERILCTDGGEPFRPHLTVILDRFDQCFLGFCLSHQGNSLTFGRALRMALLPKDEDPEKILMGRPDKLIRDRGKDFTGEYSCTVLQGLGIEPKETIGRAPWSKGDIEGFFAILDLMLVQFMKDHTGHRPTGKPVNQEVVRDIHDLNRIVRQWGFLVYNHLPFMNRRINGQQISRLQLRRSVQFPIHTMEALDVDTILLPRVTRTFGKRGITIDNIPYWNDKSQEFLRLCAEGATVEVGRDYSNLGKIWIFHNSRFICYGFNWEVMKAGVTQDDVKQRLADRRRYEKSVRDVADPILQASPIMEDYIERVAQQNARETMKIAAVAGERPRVPLILPGAASARRGAAARRPPGPVSVLRRPPAEETYVDPYSRPIPGTEETE